MFGMFIVRQSMTTLTHIENVVEESTAVGCDIVVVCHCFGDNATLRWWGGWLVQTGTLNHLLLVNLKRANIYCFHFLRSSLELNGINYAFVDV